MPLSVDLCFNQKGSAICFLFYIRGDVFFILFSVFTTTTSITEEGTNTFPFFLHLYLNSVHEKRIYTAAFVCLGCDAGTNCKKIHHEKQFGYRCD